MRKESTTHYRADIDGLRAIAVGAVVLFHAGVPGFSGGFIGVDVFFVISGYLITSIILPDIDAGYFSITSFYQRRIRRIFPALIAVIIFCITAGYVLLTPNDYQTFGRSVEATGVFVSNVFFWRQTSYFAAPASENPLLHTWSLSIEEQFYLFYPMFLVLVSNGSRKFRTATILFVLFLSFMACMGLTYYKPSAAFYLGPTRAWELLVGGIIALGILKKYNFPNFNLFVALTGLVCIVYAITYYSSSMQYPGIAALAPVLGTALLIWSGQSEKTLPHRILSAAPFTAIGLASYSIYLWHFPMFAYFEYAELGKLSSSTTAVVCGLSVAAGFLSLQFVERPFRFPARRESIPRLVVAVILVMAILVGGGTYIQVTGGVPSRMDSVSARYLDAEFDKYRHHQECMSLEDRIVRPTGACKLGALGVRPTALLWGDSHAMVTATAMENAAARNNAAFLFAASVDCSPGIGFSINPNMGPAFVATRGYQYCGEYNREMLKVAMMNPDINSVVLSSRWTNWHVGEPDSPSVGKVDIRFQDDSGVSKSLRDNKAIFVRGFDRLINALVLAHKTVWIVGPVPESSVRVPKALYLKHIEFDTYDIDIPIGSYWTRNKTVLSIFSDLAKKYPIKFIWPQKILCNDANCPVSEGGNAIYLDDNHLSVFGALKTAPLYDEIFSSSYNAMSSSPNRLQPKAFDDRSTGEQ